MNQDQVILQTFSQTPSIGKNTSVTLMPQQEQQQDFEHGFQPGDHESQKAFIEFRIKQLHNRRFMLLEMQRFRKKDDGVSTAGELPCEDSDQLCELENIRRELEQLLAKKEELERQKNASEPSANRGPCAPSYNTKGPRGGIYMLPPPQLEKEEVAPEPVTETPANPVVPVECLCQTPEQTRCPCCGEVVLTETHSRVGEASWIICCTCAMLGGVFGCCLIPFFNDRFKNVQHVCPRCQAKIHTYEPI
ncbi:uncharacterized protein LOC117546798 [Gymnodraco acuticeps]|uniref:Uncharacterized protein LOC117546798 n=1 Tax=Gymnodraco acuticeps TaxID=8218 RepID=A0A6P8U897_GYMAC|nr:uncharacterized protein LOC117546798 [Gymnodraco acuticeps]